MHTLKPLTLGELLDRTFFYYRQHFVLFVGIAALPNLVALVYGLSRILVSPLAGGLALTLVWLIATMVISVVVGTFSQGATVVAVSQIQLGRTTNVREAFAHIRAQLGELIILGINIAVRVGLGLLLLIVPGILLILRYAVAVPVAILEQNGVSASLSRSGELTKGRRGRIFVIYLLFGVLVLAGGLVWQVPVALIVRMTPGASLPRQVPVAAQVVQQFGSFLTQTLLAPIMTIALTLVYYDERVRREAFDIEHMMQQLDGANAGALPTA